MAGAQAFVEQHPWAKDVGLTIVFEGYGTVSASMPYVTGRESVDPQAQALEAMNKAPRYPPANSFVHNLMWALAGDTSVDTTTRRARRN